MIDRFEEIRNAAIRLGIEDPLLKKDVLCIGPCPGLWKTYYASRLRSERVRKVEKLGMSQYLGIEIPVDTTRKDLGEKFEASKLQSVSCERANNRPRTDSGNSW